MVRAMQQTELGERLSVADPPFSVPADITLDLPCPPSVNRTRRVHYPGLKATRDWTKRADALVTLLWANGGRPKVPLRQFECLIILNERLVRLDPDNLVKSTIDYLRRLGLIPDDSPKYFRELRIVWGDAPHGIRVVLKPREPN